MNAPSPLWGRVRVGVSSVYVALVAAFAVEGKDYDLKAMLPFWHVTNEQDWKICEDQQAGINSSRYVPGPFSRTKEQNVQNFLDWYLGELSR